MTDWEDALEDAAGNLRRLNRALAGHEATVDDLRAVARAAGELAARLEHGARRSKDDEAAALYDGLLGQIARAQAAAVGDTIEFDPFSVGGGRLHPASIEWHLVRDGGASVVATTTVHSMFQGPAGRVHGGVVALIIDELMSAVNRVRGARAFTVRLTVNLRAAAPVEEELTFRAWLHEVDGRKITMKAEGSHAGGVFADAEGLFVTVESRPA